MIPTQGRTASVGSQPLVGAMLFRGHVPQLRYAVATERVKVSRIGSGGDSREVANPDGTWHALDPETGRPMCAFDGMVHLWDGYDFEASKHASRCLDCRRIIAET